MQAIFFLLRRALLPEKGTLSTFALWISVAGVALGIAQLMLVLSVMTGFQKMLQHNYARITSELVVIPPSDQAYSNSFDAKLNAVEGIEATTPFYFGQGMVLKQGVGGVILEGIDLKSSSSVIPWKEVWVEKPLEEVQRENRRWIWIGAQLAKKLSIQQGETVSVLVAEGNRKKIIPFVVTAITKFGIYDHDLRYARIDLRELNRLMRRKGQEPMYKCRVGEDQDLWNLSVDVRDALGEEVTVKTWSEINQNIFLAVEHQKKVLFLVLEIIIALAAVNVVNLLMMSTQNRRRDVAILRAMGMRFRQVVFFFVAKGAIIGLLGIGVGIGLGFGVCYLTETFQPEILSEAIYNVTKLPLRIELGDVALVSAVAFLFCVVFSVVPALKAAMERPVQALRYE